MSIHRHAMFAHAAEQMRRIRPCNPLRRKMASDVEISRIFSLLHHLMMLFGVANGVLLRADVVPETAIAHFIFSPNYRDTFFNRGKFFFVADEFLLSNPWSAAAAYPATH